MIVSDVLMFLCVCLLLYPIISDIWNEHHTSKMFGEYQEITKNIGKETYDELLKQAEMYNNSIKNRGNSRFTMTKEEREVYESCLNIPGTDVMSYITCDKIGVKNMPVYHGSGAAVLQSGVGHYEGSSLPIGGSSTHCVLSGHTGMAGLKMFSELTKLKKGDTFQLKVLDKTLTYQVDSIHQVLPNDITYLEIEEGEDYCTLITCIPIGVNSKRLLVRGKRIQNPVEIEKTEKGKKMIETVWNKLLARFALYELVMAMAAMLIVLFFIIPDSVRIRKSFAGNRK